MPRYQPPDYYRPTGTARLVDLMLRRGDIQAQGAERSGQIWGDAVRGLGDIASGAFEQHAEQKAQEREAVAKRQRETDFVQGLQAGDMDRNKAMEIFGPKDGLMMWNAVEASEQMAQKQGAEAMGHLKDILVPFVGMSPETQKMIYPQLRGLAINSKIVPPDQIPEQLTPEFSEVLSNMAHQLNPKEKVNPVEVNGQLVDPTTGNVIGDYRNAEKPTEPRVVGRALVGPDGKVIYRDPETTSPRTENKMWVMRPGAGGKMEAAFVPESEVRPGDQPANSRTGEGRPSIGGEKAALGFFNRAKQADAELQDLEAQITAKGFGGQAWMKFAPNWLQTQEGQAYTQAQRAFTEARLRKDSGAAIPEQEFKNDRETYFAQPGDSAETAAQKARARAAVLASLAFQSGRALNEFYGDEAETILQSFKQRQGPGDGAGIITTPDGKKWKNIGGRMVEQK